MLFFRGRANHGDVDDADGEDEDEREGEVEGEDCEHVELDDTGGNNDNDVNDKLYRERPYRGDC